MWYLKLWAEQLIDGVSVNCWDWKPLRHSSHFLPSSCWGSVQLHSALSRTSGSEDGQMDGQSLSSLTVLPGLLRGTGAAGRRPGPGSSLKVEEVDFKWFWRKSSVCRMRSGEGETRGSELRVKPLLLFLSSINSVTYSVGNVPVLVSMETQTSVLHLLCPSLKLLPVPMGRAGVRTERLRAP